MGSSIAGIFGSDAEMSANKQAQGTIQTGSALAQQALNKAQAQATGYQQPYADVGLGALQQLAYGMGLNVPSKQYTVADAPTTTTGNSGDPIWDKIVNDFQAAHTARFGRPFSGSWTSDKDAINQYNQLAQQYAAAKNAEAASQGQFVGQGDKGAYLNYGLDQYKKDVGYTPMVTSLADLQATPGYQFQLEQGLQGVNNSAAAKGGLLSGANLKAINDYAQGQAATGYQAAWQRVQNAYQNAFNRNQTNIGNLKSLAGMGQNAATNQADYAMTTGTNTAKTNTSTATDIAGLQNQYGQLQGQQYNQMGGLGNQAILGAFGGNNISNFFKTGLL